MKTQLIINNEAVDASNGATFERLNSLTGNVVSQGAAATIDDANKAAVDPNPCLQICKPHHQAGAAASHPPQSSPSPYCEGRDQFLKRACFAALFNDLLYDLLFFWCSSTKREQRERVLRECRFYPQAVQKRHTWGNTGRNPPSHAQKTTLPQSHFTLKIKGINEFCCYAENAYDPCRLHRLSDSQYTPRCASERNKWPTHRAVR